MLNIKWAKNWTLSVPEVYYLLKIDHTYILTESKAILVPWPHRIFTNVTNVTMFPTKRSYQQSISTAWCKTIVTNSFNIPSYNSFALSPRYGTVNMDTSTASQFIGHAMELLSSRLLMTSTCCDCSSSISTTVPPLIGCNSLSFVLRDAVTYKFHLVNAKTFFLLFIDKMI